MNQHSIDVHWCQLIENHTQYQDLIVIVDGAKGLANESSSNWTGHCKVIWARDDICTVELMRTPRDDVWSRSHSICVCPNSKKKSWSRRSRLIATPHSTIFSYFSCILLPTRRSLMWIIITISRSHKFRPTIICKTTSETSHRNKFSSITQTVLSAQTRRTAPASLFPCLVVPGGFGLI